MIVVDASALLEVLLGTPVSAAVTRRLFEPGESLHVPHLIDLEVVQVLRRYRSAELLSESRAKEAIQDLKDFPLIRYPHDVLLDRIWELKRNMTAYDAAYVSLAEALSAVLVTRDARLAKSPVIRASVEVI